MRFNAGSSYLNEKDWNSISEYFKPLITGLKNISTDLLLQLEYGVRWPVIELSREDNERIDSFKLSLNSNYLEDEKIFFELIHTEFSKKRFCNPCLEKTEKLSIYSLKEMKDHLFILQDIERRLSNEIY